MCCSLLIFGIILIEFIKFLQAFILIPLFLKIIVLTGKCINLFLQIFIFSAQLLHGREIIFHISQPSADMIDSLLQRDNRNIGQNFERTGCFV